MGSLVQVGDFYRYGVQDVKAFPLRDGAGSADSGEDGAVVCRAYFKLQEALARGGVALPAGGVAMDAGAAPGGWTQFLCEASHCSKVYAVDPADMDILPPAGEHLRMKVQEAIPWLAERNIKLDIFVSDMCLHEVTELVQVFKAVLSAGLLKQQAVVVLTFKSVPGHGRQSYERIIQEYSQQLAAWCSHSQTIHLLSNRERERTFVGITH